MKYAIDKVCKLKKKIMYFTTKAKHKKFKNYNSGNRSARRKPTCQMSNFKSAKCSSNV